MGTNTKDEFMKTYNNEKRGSFYGQQEEEREAFSNSI